MYQNEILVKHRYNEENEQPQQQEAYVNVSTLKNPTTKTEPEPVITEEPPAGGDHYNVPPPTRPKPKEEPQREMYSAPPLPVPVIVGGDETGNSPRNSNSNSESGISPSDRLNHNQNALRVPSPGGGKIKNGDHDSHSIASAKSAKSGRSSSFGGGGTRDVVTGLVVNLDSYLQNKELIFIMETFELDDKLLECSVRPHKYRISDSHGHRIFTAEELAPTGISSFGCLQCCFGNRRFFAMTVSDKDGLEVLFLTKPVGPCLFYCACCLPCFCCCLQHQHVSIYSPADTLIGSVKQEWSLFSPKFSVYDSDGKLRLVIESQKWMTSGCFTLFCGGGGLDLKIYLCDERSGSKGEEVGQIKTSWPELENKGGVDGPTTKIGLKFPREMDSTLKSILVGACIHLSFTYTKAI